MISLLDDKTSYILTCSSIVYSDVSPSSTFCKNVNALITLPMVFKINIPQFLLYFSDKFFQFVCAF